MTAALNDDPVERLLVRLARVRKTGESQWNAACPAHDDSDPSLSIGVGADRRALVRCHAGCHVDDVMRAVGLSVADLFPESGRRGVDVVRRHRYCDEIGTVLYEVRRLKNPSGRLSWAYAHPAAAGWVKGRGDSQKVLYRLPEAIAAGAEVTVWVTEGERDADTLTGLGEVATTVASGSWSGVATTALRGRRVHVVVDNDETGWKKGTAATKAVRRAGGNVAAVLAPPERFKDVTELVEAGGRLRDLRRVDLLEDLPPVQSAEPKTVGGRPVVREDGLAWFTISPTGLLLSYIQSGDLQVGDIATYDLLDFRSGDSGVAKVTAVEVGDVLVIDRGTAQGALHRLTSVGLIKEVRRGEWRVFNPARRRNDGDPDITRRFRERKASNPEGTRLPRQPGKNPSFLNEPPTRTQGVLGNPAPDVEETGTRQEPDAGMLSTEQADVVTRLLLAFPGAEVIEIDNPEPPPPSRETDYDASPTGATITDDPKATFDGRDQGRRIDTLLRDVGPPGLTDEEIASRLGVDERFVEWHLRCGRRGRRYRNAGNRWVWIAESDITDRETQANDDDVPAARYIPWNGGLVDTATGQVMADQSAGNRS